MTDVDRMLRELSTTARDAPPPTVDVRASVARTLARASTTGAAPPPREVLPLTLAGVAMALAASAVIAFLPAWRTMFEPWAGYFPG